MGHTGIELFVMLALILALTGIQGLIDKFLVDKYGAVTHYQTQRIGCRPPARGYDHTSVWTRSGSAVRKAIPLSAPMPNGRSGPYYSPVPLNVLLHACKLWTARPRS